MKCFFLGVGWGGGRPNWLALHYSSHFIVSDLITVKGAAQSNYSYLLTKIYRCPKEKKMELLLGNILPAITACEYLTASRTIGWLLSAPYFHIKNTPHDFTTRLVEHFARNYFGVFTSTFWKILWRTSCRLVMGFMASIANKRGETVFADCPFQLRIFWTCPFTWIYLSTSYSRHSRRIPSKKWACEKLFFLKQKINDVFFDL